MSETTKPASPPAPQKRRRVIVDLEADERQAPLRRMFDEIEGKGLYPLISPGLAPPGPDFRRQALALGDEDGFEKVKVEKGGKKKAVEVLVSPGERLSGLMLRALRDPSFVMPIEVRTGLVKDVQFVPGHVWGQHAAAYSTAKPRMIDGPHRSDVMVIGKMPWHEEVAEGRCMVGESGQLLIAVLRQQNIQGTPDWYVTNVMKFQPPDGSKTPKAKWMADCMPLLQQELRIVRPKYILCVGSDASKALLGAKWTVGTMEGRVVEYTYEVGLDRTVPEAERPRHTALVMTVIHPAAVLQSPSELRRLERGVARFGLLARGVRWDLHEPDLDHRTVNNLSQLRDLLVEIDTDPERHDDFVSFDAEWNGEHPQNVGSYVRTMQIGWRPKHAAGIVWSDTEGKPAFFDDDGEPAQAEAVELLNAFFADKRPVMHFGVADLEWTEHIGLTQIARSYEVPLYDKGFDDFSPKHQAALAASIYQYGPGDVVPARHRTLVEGGWDTGLAGHAIEETALLGLEVLAMRYTTAPRYDLPLEEWKAAYCKANKLKPKDLPGYGPCPNEVLLPYAIWDADATLRLMYEQQPLIDHDYDDNNCRESFWESMLTPPVILEMHRTGMPIDMARVDFLTDKFVLAKLRQEQKIREWSKWPEFNVRSVYQVREFLYGDQYGGKRDKEGNLVVQRPEGAKSLYIEPVLDTSKPPRKWCDIKMRGQEAEHSPGTGRTILGVLLQDNPGLSEQINFIRDYRFLDQVVKSVLRPAKPKDDDEEEDDGGGGVAADDGGYAPATGGLFGGDNLAGVVTDYDGGLAGARCDDGRIRTHFYPTAETKRWRSARPPLQNLSKRRDPDYQRLLGAVKNEKGKWVGGDYKYKLRSLLYALPGHVLVEADYVGAELFVTAIMSGDAKLIEHATRNQLPESDPAFYDIHSNVAVVAFHLDCPPTKKGLESIGKIALRIAAKNVIFGLFYGRSAAAIALQCKEEGNPISVGEAQAIIDAIHAMYPGLAPFFQQARDRARDPRWLCTCFGAFRRFPETEDRMMMGEFERQAMNVPIQGGVASAIDRALAYMRDYRDDVIGDPSFFKFALQLHDAILLHVPYANVDRVIKEVLPLNMCRRVPLYPTDLAGVPTGTGPYYMGIDTEVSWHWGERLSMAECREWGIPEEYGK